jgi:predicted acylesterase/phospholipase RssA
MITRILSLVIAAALVGCASSPERTKRSTEELVVERRTDDTQRALELRELTQKLMAHVAQKARPTIDILVISGGGDWGAFGAGVLKGWSRVKGEMARPQFDVVTGVSTGALIAPFAFLGDDASIERIVELYRNPQPDVAVSRGWLFFLPGNASFYVLPGLERELRGALDRPMLERIAASGTSGRALIVNTTNIDFGQMKAWDIVAECRRVMAGGDEESVRQILLASAGIPGAFPARDLYRHLYVDGAITGNILYGGRVSDDESLLSLWSKAYPGRPLPRVRYWVIFNNQVRFPPEMVRERWPDIMSRATIMSTQTSTLNSIRHLYTKAEIERLKRNADVEVRLISVPEDYIPSQPGTFVKEVMNELVDLGEKMGADPKSWQTQAP